MIFPLSQKTDDLLESLNLEDLLRIDGSTYVFRSQGIANILIWCVIVRNMKALW
jgi:hypothetical protein